MRPPRLFASMTPLSMLDLGGDARRLLEAGADALHVDIGDGHFIPALLHNPGVVCALTKELGVEVDAHLMVERPEDWLAGLCACRPRRVWFHVEATRYPWRALSIGQRLGISMGVAINPITPVGVLERLAGSADAILVLATDHDAAGDHMLAGTVERIRAVRALAGDDKPVAVDGGVDAGSVTELVRAGADELVVGRAICCQPDWRQAVRSLRQAAAIALVPGSRGATGEGTVAP